MDATEILADRGLSPESRACLGRFFAWGASPTIDAYCDLFAAQGTLLDADMPEPISGPAIRESITRVLALLPNFRFAPVAVVQEGQHVFVLAANRAILGERPLAWEAVYALTLAGDRIGAGRRYYDQAALALGSETFAGPLADHDEADDGAPRSAMGAIDVAARADAWNRRDAAALAAPLGAVRLHLSGVARPVERGADVAAALRRFLARADGLRLTGGAVARSGGGALAIEWVGTVGTGPAARRFGLVELIAPAAPQCEWRVTFNTLGF